MDKEIYKFRISCGNEYEYLDEKLFKNRINYYISTKLIFNPHFITYNRKLENGKPYFEYLLDFIIYNKEVSLDLINKMNYSNSAEEERFSLLKEYIDSIDEIEKAYNDKFDDIIQQYLLSREGYGFNEASNVLLKFTKDFEFPMEIDLNNDNIMEMILNKIKSVSKERNLDDDEKYWIDFNTIKILIGLYDFVLEKIQKFKIQSNVMDYEKKAYINLLCDELYEYLLALLKELNTVYRSNLDYGFLSIIDWYIGNLLLECNFNKLNKREKKRLFKYYYLMMFYGNYVGNAITLTKEHFDYAAYNIFSGFKENVNTIKKDIIDDLQKYSNILDYNGYFRGNSEIIDFLDNTIFKNNLLESAYYQKALLDYSPIFKEMEYTPILVNIFKMVEELSCDLFEILGLNRTLLYNSESNQYIICCYFESGPVYFNDENWKDKIMLGGIKNLINWINIKTEEDFPMYLDGNNISVYHTAYNNRELNYNEQIVEFNEKYSNKFECELISKTGQLRNSDVLRDNFQLWINKCRNGTLHKHNVIEAEKTDFCFDFTLYTINMLLEWCYILKKSIE